MLEARMIMMASLLPNLRYVWKCVCVFLSCMDCMCALISYLEIFASLLGAA